MHDVRALDEARRLGFALKSLGDVGISGELGVDELERDFLPDGSVRAFVHGAHSAAANQGTHSPFVAHHLARRDIRGTVRLVRLTHEFR